MRDNLYIFIMAGGSGERFWPLSRARTPKHLLRLLGEQTLLETTVRRVEDLVPWDRVFVLTNVAQVDAARAELPFLPPANIIAEPEKRDTAPACALAAGLAAARQPDAVCALLPADAMIHDVAVFRRQLGYAASIAATEDALLTFAIPPTYPSTAFGYLKLGPMRESGAVAVERFVEKPQVDIARGYLAEGSYAWNAGMFVWRASVFREECERHAPPLAGFIDRFPAGDCIDFLNREFGILPKLSIDYAVMEKARHVVALRAEFDWDDVGSWTALPDHLPQDENGNTVTGNAFFHESRNNVVVSAGRAVVLCGVEDLVVVETQSTLR